MRLRRRRDADVDEDAGDRWLVVGLGNPEGEYGGTRHNVGADAVRALADDLGADLSLNKRVRCSIAEARHGHARVVLAIPTSYMNESGGPVQQAAAWFKVPPGRLIVVHDELDLEPAVVRLKLGGGVAGHNGLKDVSQRLGTRDFYRVRIGIGRPSYGSPRDHVLSRFSRQEREQVDVALHDAVDAALGIIDDGLEPTQNRIHARS